MSGQTERSVDEIMYLEAQLFDEEASMPLRIITDILDGAGALITNVELSHTSKGVFIDNAYVYPDYETVYVKYYVFESDGVTPKTDNYRIIGEKFVKRISAVVISETLTGSMDHEAEMIGSLDVGEITGNIITELPITSSVSYEILNGEVINE